MKENEFISLISNYKNSKNNKGYIAHCISNNNNEKNGATSERKDFFIFEFFDFNFSGGNEIADEFRCFAFRETGTSYADEPDLVRSFKFALINSVTIPKIFKFAAEHNCYVCADAIEIMHKYVRKNENNDSKIICKEGQYYDTCTENSKGCSCGIKTERLAENAVCNDIDDIDYEKRRLRIASAESAYAEHEEKIKEKLKKEKADRISYADEEYDD